MLSFSGRFPCYCCIIRTAHTPRYGSTDASVPLCAYVIRLRQVDALRFQINSLTLRASERTWLMASCLSPRFVFGVQGSRSNAIGFSDQATLVYLAGHTVVIYNILDGKQRFIHGSESSESITAMALCPSSRFIAIAEDSDKPIASDDMSRRCFWS